MENTDQGNSERIEIKYAGSALREAVVMPELLFRAESKLSFGARVAYGTIATMENYTQRATNETLAAAMGTSKSTAARLVGELIERGWIRADNDSPTGFELIWPRQETQQEN